MIEQILIILLILLTTGPPFLGYFFRSVIKLAIIFLAILYCPLGFGIYYYTNKSIYSKL